MKGRLCKPYSPGLNAHLKVERHSAVLNGFVSQFWIIVSRLEQGFLGYTLALFAAWYMGKVMTGDYAGNPEIQPYLYRFASSLPPSPSCHSSL